jgi:hypothetical protein
MHFKATRMFQAMLSLLVLTAFNSITWIQESKMPLGNTDFDSCVPKAFEGMTGVVVPPQRGLVHHVGLEVELSDRTIFGAEVQLREGNVADILFSGPGSKESDRQRGLITPVLASLTSRLKERCGAKS